MMVVVVVVQIYRYRWRICRLSFRSGWCSSPKSTVCWLFYFLNDGGQKWEMTISEGVDFPVPHAF